MGTDLHGVWQARINGEYVDIPTELDLYRNYDLFGVLAGVRGGFDPIDDPRGLPRDFVTRDCEVKGKYHIVPTVDCLEPWQRQYAEDMLDGFRVRMGNHSYSHLTGEEMLRWYNAEKPKAWRGLATFFQEVERCVAAYGDVRFVFGFDS